MRYINTPYNAREAYYSDRREARKAARRERIRQREEHSRWNANAAWFGGPLQ